MMQQREPRKHYTPVNFIYYNAGLEEFWGEIGLPAKKINPYCTRVKWK